MNTIEHCSFCPMIAEVLPCQGARGNVCRNQNLVCEQHSYAMDGSRLCPECHRSSGVSLQTDLTAIPRKEVSS